MGAYDLLHSIDEVASRSYTYDNMFYIQRYGKTFLDFKGLSLLGPWIDYIHPSVEFFD